MISSTVIDIDSLNPVEVIDGAGHPCAPRCGTTGATFGAAAPCAPRGIVRRYILECPYGYMGYWICAVCMKMGRDFRDEFCRIPTEEDIRRGEPIDFKARVWLDSSMQEVSNNYDN